MAPYSGAPFDADAELVAFDPWASMPGQLYDWTCSACSLEWLKRAAGLDLGTGDVYSDRETTVYQIGYPGNINPQVGLTDASGRALRAVLQTYGQDSEQGWLDFDTTYGIAAAGGGGMMSGAAWYHWVGIRGVQDADLWVANSAWGYKGIYDRVSRSDFSRLGGFSVVWLG